MDEELEPHSFLGSKPRRFVLVPALGCPRNIVMSRDMKHLGLSLETKALSLSV